MKKTMALLLLLSFSLSLPAYDRYNAVAYAKKFGKYKNIPQFNYCLIEEGGDCTNFVSQCLVAGGVVFSKDEPADSAGAWDWSVPGGRRLLVRACELPAAIKNPLRNRGTELADFKGRTYQDMEGDASLLLAKGLKPGDYVYFYREADWNKNENIHEHSVFVTAITGIALKDILVAWHGHEPAHDGESSDKRGNSLQVQVIRGYPNFKILHVYDSPLVRRVTVLQEGRLIYEMTNLYDEFENANTGLKENKKEKLKAGIPAEIRVVFDTTISKAEILFKKGSDSFKVSDVNVMSRTKYENDTLKAPFTLQKAGNYKLSIDAFGEDGSETDTDGTLDSYVQGPFEKLSLEAVK